MRIRLRCAFRVRIRGRELGEIAVPAGYWFAARIGRQFIAAILARRGGRWRRVTCTLYARYVVVNGRRFLSFHGSTHRRRTSTGARRRVNVRGGQFASLPIANATLDTAFHTSLCWQRFIATWHLAMALYTVCQPMCILLQMTASLTGGPLSARAVREGIVCKPSVNSSRSVVGGNTLVRGLTSS